MQFSPAFATYSRSPWRASARGGRADAPPGIDAHLDRLLDLAVAYDRHRRAARVGDEEASVGRVEQGGRARTDGDAGLEGEGLRVEEGEGAVAPLAYREGRAVGRERGGVGAVAHLRLRPHRARVVEEVRLVSLDVEGVGALRPHDDARDEPLLALRSGDRHVLLRLEAVEGDAVHPRPLPRRHEHVAAAPRQTDPAFREGHALDHLSRIEIDEIEGVVVEAAGVHERPTAPVEHDDVARHIAGQVDRPPRGSDAPAVREGEPLVPRVPPGPPRDEEERRGDGEGRTGGEEGVEQGARHGGVRIRIPPGPIRAGSPGGRS